MQVSKSLILNLYKNLCRYGKELKHTDTTFYHKYIRNQFESVDKQDNIKIERLYKVNSLFKI